MDRFITDLFRTTVGSTGMLGENHRQEIERVFDVYYKGSNEVVPLCVVGEKDFKNVFLRLRVGEFPLVSEKLKLENIERLNDIPLNLFLELSIEFSKATEKSGDWLEYMVRYIIKKSK